MIRHKEEGHFFQLMQRNVLYGKIKKHSNRCEIIIIFTKAPCRVKACFRFRGISKSSDPAGLALLSTSPLTFTRLKNISVVCGCVFVSIGLL